MANGPAAEIERDEYLLAQVHESFGRVVYSQKTHEKQADLCFRKHRRQQAALVAFTAISTGTFLASLLGNFVSPQMTGLATSFIAIVVTVLSLGAKSFKFGEESEAHRDIASRLWDVRESYLSLVTDLRSGATSEDDARARRDALQEAARAAYSAAPRTSNKAFKKASEGLKSNEEMTFSSREIDLFLPEALRLNESEA